MESDTQDPSDQFKQQAALAAAHEVRQGMVVGLGTGSTADHATRYLAERNVQIEAVATSKNTQELAQEVGIRLTPIDKIKSVDILIDGADECTIEGKMIKGGGGALFREKLVASISKRCLYVMDESKLVETLGSFALPIEVNIFGWQITAQKLTELNLNPNLRYSADEEAFVTDNGHYILDCQCVKIDDPNKLSDTLSQVVGVVETGLFLDQATEIFVAGKEGLRHWKFDKAANSEN